MESKEKNKDFFDEIIDSLRSCEEDSPASYVSKEVLLEFYRPSPGQTPVRKAASSGRTVSPCRTNEVKEKRTVEEVRQENTVPAHNIPAAGFAPTENMSMEELQQAVSICSKCPLCRTRTNTVFGDGDIKSRLMFIGEGPGADEDAQGLPFVGKAGELLTKMINAMGFARKEVYIGNIVKCRPPENRTPEDEEIQACLPYIKQQIRLIQPDAIVLLGATPLKGLFNITGITRMRGKFLDYNGTPAMPTFHPAFLLRKAEAKREAWHDLKLVMAKLGIAV